jgi:hypothetical protein
MITDTNTDITTIELNQEQLEFLRVAMDWWQTSGANAWSARSASEIYDKLV